MAIAIRSANRVIFPIRCNNISSGNDNDKRVRKNKPLPPILVSTNPSHINIHTLSNLYLSCNHSPHRFPLSNDIDPRKLAVAVSHSSVVVSVFAAVRDSSGGFGGVEEEREKGLWGRILPAVVTSENGELVGFGRAVSDLGLTASIHDVMVIPSLRRLGIGQMVVQRILRILINKGIYDISALCSEEERLFFAACGFGDDLLGSTTMMYTNTANSNSDHDQVITRAGRILLVAPPSRLSPSQKQPPHLAC
ncbi:hypothetical protein SOVF_213260 [Spinacia oleracea]|uniref:Uncharacterized protein isoform X1 n=1 Tax=Spinacia oleracea TaxID=3562 RepID=A0A9R0JLF3_SPIOL|nr:uncharacterized protein LOC110778370 isoform X1 [Spinacia oleracea]KNA03005.1 hypothetical protein SOVF_213260 [Spinacia oleracea]